MNKIMKPLSDILPLKDWFPGFGKPPLVISGPCGIESEEQLLSTAKEIDKIPGVTVLRAGVWKPRTRPESFEGVGNIGLEWLSAIKKETRLLTMVEVATEKHVEQCLKYDIDIVWIGARSTSNPFSIQELADVMRNTGIAVMVKNPVNPDLDLWIGALERFSKAGIKKIAAIHRGFFPFEKTVFRNIPKWEIPIELKRRFHHLPIICDPSHISGSARYVKEIAQKAMDLNMDGLMIETHIDPKKALSDSKQQLTPSQLRDLLNSLVYRNTTSGDPGFNNQLELLREQIDSVDSQMIELLAKRMQIVREIGKYKSENNITILQLRRWEQIIKRVTDLGKKLGLSEAFVKKLLENIHNESIQLQTEIMKKLREK